MKHTNHTQLTYTHTYTHQYELNNIRFLVFTQIEHNLKLFLLYILSLLSAVFLNSFIYQHIITYNLQCIHHTNFNMYHVYVSHVVTLSLHIFCQNILTLIKY
eukprot:UN03494